MRSQFKARSGLGAFTLIELLVVIAIIGVLAALLFPVLSKGKQKTQGVYCLNNAKQMMVAMTLYVGDHHDLFPPNPDDGNSVPGYNWCSGDAGRGHRAEFNPDFLKDSARCLGPVICQPIPPCFIARETNARGYIREPTRHCLARRFPRPGPSP